MFFIYLFFCIFFNSQTLWKKNYIMLIICFPPTPLIPSQEYSHLSLKRKDLDSSSPKGKALLTPVKPGFEFIRGDSCQFIIFWHKRVTVLVVTIASVLGGSVCSSLFIHPFISSLSHMRHVGYMLSLLDTWGNWFWLKDLYLPYRQLRVPIVLCIAFSANSPVPAQRRKHLGNIYWWWHLPYSVAFS